jgi:hypothetical protein
VIFRVAVIAQAVTLLAQALLAGLALCGSHTTADASLFGGDATLLISVAQSRRRGIVAALIANSEIAGRS